MTSWTITQPVFHFQGAKEVSHFPIPIVLSEISQFTHYFRDGSSLPRQPFCQPHGISFQGHSLQTVQMESNVVWKQMQHLAWSMRAFLILRQNLPHPPPTILVYITPLWHHVASRNKNRLTESRS